MAALGDALRIWTGIEQAVRLSRNLLDIDLDAIEVNGTPVTVFVARLNERLRMLADALSAQDPVGTADTLLYELPEVVQDWRDVLQTLRRVVSEGGGSAWR